MARTVEGWSNYETWTVALFINNESNECIEDATRAALRDEHGDALKEYVESYFLTDPATDEYLGGHEPLRAADARCGHVRGQLA